MQVFFVFWGNREGEFPYLLALIKRSIYTVLIYAMKCIFIGKDEEARVTTPTDAQMFLKKGFYLWRFDVTITTEKKNNSTMFCIHSVSSGRQGNE
jgi:hypothetical protein